MHAEPVTRTFSDLVEDAEPSLRRHVRRATKGDPALVDELVAETFARAWEHRARFVDDGGSDAFTRWLHGIAANVVGHALRSRGVERRAFAQLTATDAVAEPDHVSDVIERVDARRAEHSINAGLELLTHEQRDAVAMRVVQGASYDEIAGVMHTTTTTARARVSRALRTLAVVLAALLALAGAAAAASGRLDDLVDALWPSEQRAEIPSIETWERSEVDSDITVVENSQIAATVEAMPVGARRELAGRMVVTHPRTGVYHVTAPAPVASSYGFPGIGIVVFDSTSRADLTMPDPRTGVRYGTVERQLGYRSTPKGRVFEMTFHVRRYAPMSADGMECVRRSYRDAAPAAADSAAVRSALDSAIQHCRFIPTVDPLLDIEATKRDGVALATGGVLDMDAGTPVDLTGDMRVAFSIVKVELPKAQWSNAREG